MTKRVSILFLVTLFSFGFAVDTIHGSTLLVPGVQKEVPFYGKNFNANKNLNNSPISETEASNERAKTIIEISKWVGVGLGAAIGILHLYWSIRYTPNTEIPLWKHLVSGVPPGIISAIVGGLTLPWITKLIMNSKPGIITAGLKGAMFGALAGSIVLASNYIFFLPLSYYLGTIHFNNMEGNYIFLKLLGMAVLGSIAYGGTFGAVAGVFYGPSISIAMRY